MVAALERAGIRDQFDLFFVSDHGHSTVQAHNTLRDYLHQAATDLGDGLPPLATASDYIYAMPGAPEPHASQLAPLVDWLYAQPWCDVVFSGLEGHDALPGVLSLARLWNGRLNDRRPLLAVSPRWTEDANDFGVPGTVASLTTQAALKSSHGSMSPFDMHALMIANGPSFREGHVSEVPTGATDLAPTVLTLLDLAVPDAVDGRVLSEALQMGGGLVPAAGDEILAPVADVHRDDSPRVRLHHVGTTSYVHGSVHR